MFKFKLLVALQIMLSRARVAGHTFDMSWGQGKDSIKHLVMAELQLQACNKVSLQDILTSDALL